MMDKRTIETVKIFNDAAQGYQDKYMDVSSYAASLVLFCDSLSSQDGDVLDVACGPGNVAKFIADKRPGTKIMATDLSRKMLDLTKINVPNACTSLMNAKDIKTVGQQFDGILASFIFPYLSKSEVIDFINDASVIMKKSGVLYISTMQGKNSNSGYEGPSDGVQMYMNYHEVTYLEKALTDSGFAIVSSIIKPYDYGGDNNGTDIIIIGKLKA
ncbi:MAG: cyclopropane fatty-acyl-phospholipid synthase-like methyltransferase [Saprospiraceae bacterium]|jgi:cyclopropane fatty-acyl-phospholipid synthase-like methyltransferase